MHIEEDENFMADIVLSEKKKVNIFDRIIQTVVIMVNMSK